MNNASAEERNVQSSIRFRLATWFAPLLLLIVAGHHFARTSLSALTPWKGGGFGMFSTIDDQDYRRVRIFVETNEGSLLPAELEGSFRQELTRLRFLPEPGAKTRLSTQLLEQRWKTTSDRGIPSARLVSRKAAESSTHFRPRRVVIETQSIWFDRATREITPRPLGFVEITNESR